ncbi:MAG: hypothetical protein JWO80_3626 [Bryobacterales bacterium]|nr:hypothetical protein [Bryobacterales bacterium]
MRVIGCLWLAAAIHVAGATAPEIKPAKQDRSKAKRASALGAGIRTPGIQIPFASLTAVARFPTPAKPEWIYFSDSVFVPNSLKDGVDKLDPKTNKPGDPITGVAKPCAGMANAFGSLWIPACGSGSLVRLDPKSLKETTKLAIGTAVVARGIAATADSVWVLTDTKTTLARIDPDQNQVVGEVRLPQGCKNLTFGEGALWLVCPAEDKVYRVNPATNLLEKPIEVSAQPEALAVGEGSVWVLCRKEGKVDRIDPKTNKVTKSIELNVPGADGAMAFGEGSLWITMTGFPITRINPVTEKVMQQFHGEGGGAIELSTGALWLSNVNEGTLWRIDPKRIAATLAE